MIELKRRAIYIWGGAGCVPPSSGSPNDSLHDSLPPYLSEETTLRRGLCVGGGRLSVRGWLWGGWGTTEKSIQRSFLIAIVGTERVDDRIPIKPHLSEPLDLQEVRASEERKNAGEETLAFMSPCIGCGGGGLVG